MKLTLHTHEKLRIGPDGVIFHLPASPKVHIDRQLLKLYTITSNLHLLCDKSVCFDPQVADNLPPPPTDSDT
jgi:hypothetical protein